ncbi:hypothetical protein AB4Y45_34720 [Paraburkholderia sp. EG287A]|uniref:hypothetical protein n=1 Tax=Paraburkholderia sp. EG287A TaxID=3237012 RepID=UPI0034D2229E
MSQLSIHPNRGFRRFLLVLAARLCISWVAAGWLAAAVAGFCAIVLVVTALGSLYGLTGVVMVDWLFGHGRLLPSLLAGTPLDGYASEIRHGVVTLLLFLLVCTQLVRGLRALGNFFGLIVLSRIFE